MGPLLDDKKGLNADNGQASHIKRFLKIIILLVLTLLWVFQGFLWWISA